MSVLGIGGVFFRANDPEAQEEWYRKHLGVVVDGTTPWMQDAGPTMFVPFARDTEHFPAAKQYMINFRVAELDRLLSTLRDAGIPITTNPEWDSPQTGRFAHIVDPEGNQIELWEPPSE